MSSFYPEVGDQLGVTELIATGDAALRGLAVLRFVNPSDADRMWPATRAYLLGFGGTLRDEAEKSP